MNRAVMVFTLVTWSKLLQCNKCSVLVNHENRVNEMIFSLLVQGTDLQSMFVLRGIVMITPLGRGEEARQGEGGR